MALIHPESVQGLNSGLDLFTVPSTDTRLSHGGNWVKYTPLQSETTPIDLYHGQDSFYKVWPDTKTKHTTGKSKSKLVSGPIVRLIHQNIAKRHQFENCDFYKVLYGR